MLPEPVVAQAGPVEAVTNSIPWETVGPFGGMLMFVFILMAYFGFKVWPAWRAEDREDRKATEERHRKERVTMGENFTESIGGIAKAVSEQTVELKAIGVRSTRATVAIMTQVSSAQAGDDARESLEKATTALTAID